MKTSLLWMSVASAVGGLLLWSVACGSSSTSGPGDNGMADGGPEAETGVDSGLASGQCRAPADCQGGGGGVACQRKPSLPALCNGKCDNNFNSDCQMDSDCAEAGADLVCAIICDCPHGGAQTVKHCTKGCSVDADCADAQACNSTHRCVAKACAKPTDCPANFTCSGGTCAYKPCTSDSECNGYCLTDFFGRTGATCSPSPGSCQQQVP